ncbi:16S rRNA (uracil(1498)-N(3))-methyltransferase [Nitrosomonas sp. HPC101]|uniref:16S rRNA (uracil(1498)-N(3))-methyltransferase n=1 Tax=Nitrosomonas sp. HPC101 TaxID=1658667 RepID=UPI001370EE5B|nr:16S rRNA (uracil(1498)-N(3))-methyltransferase [Nitrosomonas sp. HPC101]MXS85841.1 16S rRNA (uracil(1498)-N(3))-methyltransferase [Nitrosomonas sp. HPC101]
MTARFFHATSIHGAEQITLDSDTSHHAAQVLRLRQGDRVTLFDGTGGEFFGYIAQISKSACVVKIEHYQPIERESPLRITLAQAVCANEKMDWIIQKAVEQGIVRIQPLITGRTLVRLTEERARKRGLHWQKIIISACEQCGRNRIPQLLPAIPLSHWLEKKLMRKQKNNNPSGHDIILSPVARLRLTELSPPESGESITLLTGPEGGFTEEETGAVLHAGFIPIRLGNRILRTESAALAAIAAAQTLWGDY